MFVAGGILPQPWLEAPATLVAAKGRVRKSVMKRSAHIYLAAIVGSLVVCAITARVSSQAPKSNTAQFQRDNLVAWCIVPFDGKKRGPAERAEMIKRIGMRRVAYDWRENHVAEFEQEILEYKKHGIEYFAFWSTHEEALKLFEKHGLHPQIWQMLPAPVGETQRQRVEDAARKILALVERTRKLGSKLGLYNHGGWTGEPENMVAVCKYLREHHAADHVGIVYNQHHAHSRIDDFAEIIALMKPYLLCLNLNGMATNGDQVGKKILPLGEGEHDVRLTKIIRESGYKGPIGIIGHTQDDVEQRLLDNLEGLEWVLPQLDGKPAAPKPKLRTYDSAKEAASLGGSLGGTLLAGDAAYRQPPITVEARVTLPRKDQYNIVVASDAKRSGAHWEIFSMNGSGMLTAYLPGLKPDHVNSKAMICDNKTHRVAMLYEPKRVRLFVDGKQVADQQVESLGRPTVPGSLGIGRLVQEGLRCSGPVDWVRISGGVRDVAGMDSNEIAKDDRTLVLWQAAAKDTAERAPEYSPEAIKQLLAQADKDGDANRGLMVFSSAKSACLSCHKIGKHGGSVGPDLTKVGQERKPEEIVEAVLWPKRTVKKEFVAHHILFDDGTVRQGYIVDQNEQQFVFRDPTRPNEPNATIKLENVEDRREVGTLMPDNLIASMSEEQLTDLISLLVGLGREDGILLADVDSLLEHAYGHLHGPATFPYERKPLHPEHWPSWEHRVNRDRLYDFYAKEADYFRQQGHVPAILPEYPGLDGGELGHWGNQDEATWASGAWNETDLGNLQCGIFRAPGRIVPRGICVRLGDDKKISACFDPETLTYPFTWKDGFLKFSSVRHGFLGGLQMDGQMRLHLDRRRPSEPFEYHGFYRHGDRVTFVYTVGGKKFFETPWAKDGQFVTHIREAGDPPPPEAQWPKVIKTRIEHGGGSPYAIDTIQLPFYNPWNALPFFGGHAFLPDGSALACTMQGDVWHISDLPYPSQKARWRRFAAGLSQCQGLLIDDDGIFVLGRDQITRLHDLNDDGEADFYERFSSTYQASSAGHDFICGLERDAAGNFYTASGNQGVVRISPDGKRADVMATGFRNPDGIGVTPDGVVTVPCSEGTWTPASMVCAFRPHVGRVFNPSNSTDGLKTHPTEDAPHFGFPGPRDDKPPALPFVYFPRGVDNSAGGQTTVTGDRWGPLQGQIVHTSFGTGSHFLLLRDEVDGQLQGAVVPLPGEFQSGAHRARFNPADGQLYVSGMQGWGCYTPEVGCFQRVRYTGERVQLPIGFRVHQNGVVVKFSSALDQEIVSQTASHFAQCWNYRYSGAYGSPEFSTKHFGIRGHDALRIESAQVLKDGTSLFLEIPDIQPANQIHLRLQSAEGELHELFVTAHKLAKPFTGFAGYRPQKKTVSPHPILADLAMATKSVPNPHANRFKPTRPITIETGTNLTFATRSFKVRSGEAISLTLSNPDVVPHNWALVKPGTLQRVGQLANKLISDPEAAVRQYIPNTDDVLVYTDVVLPRGKFTVYFRAPKQPGRYPYLCTFPGHWLVMNGEMIVEEAVPK
ncbi:MAG: heme-binding domain-containing protein [Planctomycetaceae bacterium]|nr:heme-binding domain-containing protein [Planctomycetaceae bacterium]